MCSGAMYGSVPPTAARSAPARDLRVLGEVEVQQHRPAVVGQEHVRRLQVAVQDAAGVRVSQSVGELTDEREHGLDVRQTFELCPPVVRREHRARRRGQEGSPPGVGVGCAAERRGSCGRGGRPSRAVRSCSEVPARNSAARARAAGRRPRPAWCARSTACTPPGTARPCGTSKSGRCSCAGVARASAIRRRCRTRPSARPGGPPDRPAAPGRRGRTPRGPVRVRCGSRGYSEPGSGNWASVSNPFGEARRARARTGRTRSRSFGSTSGATDWFVVGKSDGGGSMITLGAWRRGRRRNAARTATHGDRSEEVPRREPHARGCYGVGRGTRARRCKRLGRGDGAGRGGRGRGRSRAVVVVVEVVVGVVVVVVVSGA